MNLKCDLDYTARYALWQLATEIVFYRHFLSNCSFILSIVVTAPSSSASTDHAFPPPARPVAEVHPQTHVTKSPPRGAGTVPPLAASPTAGANIEKVTLPPPPTKSPVKKTSKVKTRLLEWEILRNKKKHSSDEAKGRVVGLGGDA